MLRKAVKDTANLQTCLRCLNHCLNLPEREQGFTGGAEAGKGKGELKLSHADWLKVLAETEAAVSFGTHFWDPTPGAGADDPWGRADAQPWVRPAPGGAAAAFACPFFSLSPLPFPPFGCPFEVPFGSLPVLPSQPAALTRSRVLCSA